MGRAQNETTAHELSRASARPDVLARAEEDQVKRPDRVVELAVAVALLALASPARAALGEPATSVEKDGAALAMERQAPRVRAAATVHELRSPNFAVREFAASSGTVYAVAWSGFAPPDLPLLLGAYHAEYRAAAARLAIARGPRRVETDRIVVEHWGHGRDLHGRAWVKGLVPAGASLDDVQ